MPIYKGQTKIVKLYKGTTQIIKRYKGTNLIYTSSRLPSGYIECAYIESTGTQYINTGVNTTNDIGTEIRFSYNNNVNYQYAIGELTAGNNRFSPIFIDKDSPNKFLFTDTIAFQYNEYANFDNLPHTIKFNYPNRKISFDNTLIKTTADTFATSTGGNIYLFARNYSGVSHTASIKLYFCKLYANDTLIRDFIPCYRKSDNRVGLYDIVNDVFYVNQGTGVFNYKLKDWKDLYQPVEYIEGTGTQYIDTLFTPTSLSKVIVNIRITDENADAYFGVYKGNIYNYLGYYKGAKKFQINYVTEHNFTTSDILNTHEYEIDYSNNRVRFDETTESDSSSAIPVNTFGLFAIHRDSSWQTYSSSQLVYSCKIYDNNILVRDFRPCYRKTDNEIGLYDIVNDVFYINNGTGTFIKGPDV